MAATGSKRSGGRSAGLLDPDRFLAGPPHDLLDELREIGAERTGEGPTGTPLTSAFRASDIAAVSKDPGTWSSWEGGIFPHPDQVNHLDLNRNLLLFMDPPEHTKYRKILQTAFVPHAVSQLEGRIRAIVSEVLDEAFAHRSFDFVAAVSVPIPLRVLADLMGLPGDDIPQLLDWTDRIEESQRSTEPAASTPVMEEMAAYLLAQIERQKAAGADSLVTTLAAAEVDGETLTDIEILVFFALLVFAGNDTTRNTLSAGMLALLEHPDQLDLLRREPERITGAVEEILRWTTVVEYFCRTAKTDAEVAGCPVAGGEKVMLWYASGSRDPELNDDPHRFDVTRPEPRHMAFGGGGRHFCLGAGLARLELRVALEEILARTASIEPAGTPARLRSNWANALTSLPVQIEPAPNEESTT